MFTLAARRLLTLLGLAAAVTAVAVAIAGPTAAAPRAVDVALEHVVPVGSCGAMAAMLLAEDEAPDAAAAAADGWVSQGSKFRGTAAAAAVAFGGDLLASDADEAWILTESPSGEPIGLQLRRTEPAGSTATWKAGDVIRKVDCP